MSVLPHDLSTVAPGSISDLPIPGAWIYKPQIHTDARGSFHEAFRQEQFTQHVGVPFNLAQMNLSRSSRAVVRGIHLADVPPGQAKFVMCAAGAIRDVLVDLRLGSPTFGHHVMIDLDDNTELGVYIPVGVGHAFVTVSDQAVVTYMVTEAYNPAAEWGINPLDPELEIDWMLEEPVLSEKDSLAPYLADVRDRLPNFREVRAWEHEMRAEWQAAMEFADTEWDA